MAGPIAVGPANPSWITPYYVPPNNEPPNAFAAYMSGFMQTRAPLARAEFARRLATLSPQDRSKEIADLIKARADYVSQARSAAATIEQSQPDLWEIASKIDTTKRQEGTKASITNAEVSGKLIGAEALTAAQNQKVREAARGLDDQVTKVLSGDVDVGAAIDEVQLSIMAAYAGIPGDAGSSGATGGMTSAQMSAAARQLQDRVDAVRRRAAEMSDDDPRKDKLLLFARGTTDVIRAELAEPGLANRDQVLAGGGSGLKWLEGAVKDRILSEGGGGTTRTSVSGSEGGSYRGPGGASPMAGANALSNVDAALADDPTLKFFDSQIESLQAQHGRPSAPAWAVENPTEYLRNPLLWKPPGTSERFEPAAPAAPSRPTGIGREEVLGGASQQIMNQLRKRQAGRIATNGLPEAAATLQIPYDPNEDIVSYAPQAAPRRF